MTLKPERIDFHSTWSRLKKTCEEVIRVEKVDKREWNDRFSDVYKLCVAFPEPLSDRLYSEMKIFLQDHVDLLYQQLSDSPSDQLLNVYHKHWLEFKQGVQYLNQLYMYLNTQHIKKLKASDADLMYGSTDYSDQKLEVGELGLHLWRLKMIQPLRHDLITLLLDAIRQDRLGNIPNVQVVKGVILSLVEVEEYKKKGSLDLYQKEFESEFLIATAAHYKQEADRLLQQQNCTCSEYMERVLALLDSENVRSRRYLHSSSYARVTATCEKELVAQHMEFLHSECRQMVSQDQRRDLHNMYKLLKPIEMGLPVLVKQVQDHITKMGMNAISNIASGDTMAQSFVESVLQLHRTYSLMIREVFNNDLLFIGALDKACSAVVNHRRNPKQQCRSPELLSRYCDSLLKKSAKNIPEAEIDDLLTSAITIFKYIDDKDVFQKFYAKMFAKRLIHTQSVSMDCEEQMINKLKTSCGYEFTSKFHRMFTDIKLSDDLNSSFAEWCRSDPVCADQPIGVSFNIFVLQAGAWPLGQTALSSFALPQPFEKPVSYFESFYNKKFNGRKLTWLHHLSTVEMKINMPYTTNGDMKKSYQVSMGTFHMAILHLFESTDSLTYKEIQENTKLSEEQLVKHLQSLLEIKLLLTSGDEEPTSGESLLNPSASATPVSREEKSGSPALMQTPQPHQMFHWNAEFTNKRTKFKITAVVQKEVQQQVEVEQTHASVDEDRKLYLQAAIVRIVKARKVMKHNSLMEEVINQSVNRFTPNVTMIKKCIESLIEKGYLERTPNSTDEYSYIA